MEQWKTIPGCVGVYEASNLGNIRKLTPGRDPKVLRKYINISGYYVVAFRERDKWRTTYVHKLVARAWMKNPKHKPQVDHINTDRLDNRVENLRWVTPKENSSNPLTRKHRIEALKGQWEYAGPRYVRGVKKERGSAAKVRERKHGRPVHLYRRLYDFDIFAFGDSWIMVTTFENAVAAAAALGVNRSSISYACTGRGLCLGYKMTYGKAPTI